MNFVVKSLVVVVTAGILLSGCSDDDKPTGPGPRPTPLFEFSTESENGPRVHRAITFDATGSSGGSGSIDSYNWSFGDGTSAEGAVAKKTYTEAGTYIVTLEIEASGTRFRTSEKISIRPNQPPVARFTYTDLTWVGSTVTFDAARSSDPDGDIQRVDWIIQGRYYTDAVVVRRRFDTPGAIDVKVTVYDNDGASASVSRTINITLSGLPRDCDYFDGNYALYGQTWPKVGGVSPAVMRYDKGLPAAWREAFLHAAGEWHWRAGACISFQYYTEDKELCDGGCQDGENGLSIARIDGRGGILAQTSTWYRTGTNDLVEADVVLDISELWGFNLESDRVDALSVMAHELGHVWGLDHPAGEFAQWETMFSAIATGSVYQRSLYCGDMRGLRAAYGTCSKSIDIDDDPLATGSATKTVPPPVVEVAEDNPLPSL